MAKITFNKLGLKKLNTVKTIKFNDNEIEVKLYLPSEEKESLIELVTQNSMEYGFINPLKLERYLHLYFVYKYSNISFSDSNRKDENALYDILDESGLIDAIINASYDEYQTICEKCLEYVEKYENYQNSFYGMASKIVNSIPENMAQAMDALQELDLNKISETMKIASINAGNANALENYINGQNK